MNNKLENLINEVMAPSAIEVGTAMKKSLENIKKVIANSELHQKIIEDFIKIKLEDYE